MTQALSASGFDLTPLSEEEKQTRARSLSEEERRILLNQGTEPPFCGGLLDNKDDGTCHCKLCDLPLFTSSAKFESGTGWPSFYEPFDPQHIRELHDSSHGMVRVETVCSQCGAHLGHVFDDGPTDTGLRYCMNSASLEHQPKD